MEVTAVLSLIVQILYVLLLFVLLLIGWQVFRVLRDAAQITRRIELLTDISGWLKFFKKIKSVK
jgi:hypothetical protein